MLSCCILYSCLFWAFGPKGPKKGLGSSAGCPLLLGPPGFESHLPIRFLHSSCRLNLELPVVLNGAEQGIWWYFSGRQDWIRHSKEGKTG